MKIYNQQAQVSIGTRAQLLILHLYILQALCIFEDYGLIVSIGTRAQQAQVGLCTKAQQVIRAQVSSFPWAQRVMRALVFIFIYSGSASSVNI